MWFGAYVCFEHTKFEKAKGHINVMINGKAERVCDKCDYESDQISCCNKCEQNCCLRCIRKISTVDNIDFFPTGIKVDCVFCDGIKTIDFEMKKLDAEKVGLNHIDL